MSQFVLQGSHRSVEGKSHLIHVSRGVGTKVLNKSLLSDLEVKFVYMRLEVEVKKKVILDFS